MAKDKLTIIIFAMLAFSFGILVGAIVIGVLQAESYDYIIQQKNYYKDQANNFCEMSNEYHDLTVLLDDSLEESLPAKYDCNYILGVYN